MLTIGGFKGGAPSLSVHVFTFISENKGLASLPYPHTISVMDPGFPRRGAAPEFGQILLICQDFCQQLHEIGLSGVPHPWRPLGCANALWILAPQRLAKSRSSTVQFSYIPNASSCGFLWALQLRKKISLDTSEKASTITIREMFPSSYFNVKMTLFLPMDQSDVFALVRMSLFKTSI